MLTSLLGFNLRSGLTVYLPWRQQPDPMGSFRQTLTHTTSATLTHSKKARLLHLLWPNSFCYFQQPTRLNKLSNQPQIQG